MTGGYGPIGVSGYLKSVSAVVSVWRGVAAPDVGGGAKLEKDGWVKILLYLGL